MAAFGAKKLIPRWIERHADNDLTIVFQRQRYAKAWVTVSKIRRPVERVDDPFPCVLSADRDGISRFLGKDRVLGIIRFDPIDDERLGRQIGFSDKVDIAFFRDLQLTPEFLN